MRPARRDLIILGAAGFGREILWLTADIPEADRDWRVAGFLDDDVDSARASLGRMGVALPVLGTIRDHRPRADQVFASAIGMSRPKLAICEEIRARGGQFIDIIHPASKRHSTVVSGVGLILGPLSGLGPNCTVGDFVVLSASAGTGHDTVLGDGCFLGARCDVMGGARLGRGVFLGSHVTVHPGVSVGAFTTVGSGSTVVHTAPADVSMLGVPARTLVL